MNYALQRVANTMIPELEKYSIEVIPESNLVVYLGVAKRLPPYSDTPVCKRVLKEYIDDAKAREKKKSDDNQTNLLGDI
jgi:hypothetical protein